MNQPSDSELDVGANLLTMVQDSMRDLIRDHGDELKKELRGELEASKRVSRASPLFVESPTGALKLEQRMTLEMSLKLGEAAYNGLHRALHDLDRTGEATPIMMMMVHNDSFKLSAIALATREMLDCFGFALVKVRKA